jgi:hypothetical protein
MKECPNFRLYVGGIREAIRKGRYTYEDIGSSETEVLELALRHAGEATLRVSRYPLVDLSVKNALMCDLLAAQGAHKPPAYAENVIILQKKRQTRAA